MTPTWRPGRTTAPVGREWSAAHFWGCAAPGYEPRRLPPGRGIADGPESAGLASVSPENVALEALKPAERPGSLSEIIARVRETAGRPAPDARLKLGRKVIAASRVRLDEEPVEGRVEIEGCEIRFSLGAGEVATFHLRISTGAEIPR